MRTVKWIDVNGRKTTREEGISSRGHKATSEVGRERATKKKIMKQKQNQHIQRLKILPRRCHSGLVRKWIMPVVNVL